MAANSARLLNNEADAVNFLAYAWSRMIQAARDLMALNFHLYQIKMNIVNEVGREDGQLV